MFDAQKLLGSLIADGLGGSRKRRGSGLKWQLGLGAVGVAMAAWEHFNSQQPAQDPAAMRAGPPPPPPGPSGTGPGSPPSLPPAAPAGGAATLATMPPPSATSTAAAAAATTGTAALPDDGTTAEATLLIRAMICAANADGRIDADEQTRILDRLVGAGLGSEERAFLVRELAAPTDPAVLFTDVREPLLAEEIYVVSRLAITVDAAAEHAYLVRLAHRLGLTPERVAELELSCSPR